MDDGNQLGYAVTYGGAELEEPFTLDFAQEASLLGHSLPQHLVLFLDELDLSPELVLGTAGQEEQE
jgi:hypothetical protein